MSVIHGRRHALVLFAIHQNIGRARVPPDDLKLVLPPPWTIVPFCCPDIDLQSFCRHFTRKRHAQIVALLIVQGGAVILIDGSATIRSGIYSQCERPFWYLVRT